MRNTGMTFDEAQDRVSFDLCYSYAARTINPDGMEGGEITDAFNPEGAMVSGDWSAEIVPSRPDGSYSEDDRRYDYVRRMFEACVNESIHECLEWFQIDREPMINPHDPAYDAVIMEWATQFADKLYTLRDRNAIPRKRTPA